MPAGPNGSFIPKKTPSASRPIGQGRYLGLFGYVSFILFFGALLLAAGMFFFSQYVIGIKQDRESQLDQIRTQFSQAEMDRVVTFDRYLQAANTLFASSASLQSVFDGLERSVAQSVVFRSMSMERANDDSISFNIEAVADSFGTTLFQRDVFAELPLLQAITVDDVRLQRDALTTASGESDLSSLLAIFATNDIVTMSLELQTSATELPFTPQDVLSVLEPVTAIDFTEEEDEAIEFEDE